MVTIHPRGYGGGRGSPPPRTPAPVPHPRAGPPPPRRGGVGVGAAAGAGAVGGALGGALVGGKASAAAGSGGFPVILPGGKVVANPRGLRPKAKGAAAGGGQQAGTIPVGGTPKSAVTPEGFARSLLARLGAPATKANVDALVAWQAMEGGNWRNTARFNPLNTTQQAPGSRAMNNVGVQSYNSWQQGLKATVDTLNNGNYNDVLAALHSGKGLSGNLAGLSKWSGNTYSSISAAAGAGYANVTGTPGIPSSSAGGGGGTGGGGGASAGAASTASGGGTGGGASGGGSGGGGGGTGGVQTTGDVVNVAELGLIGALFAPGAIFAGQTISAVNAAAAGAAAAIDWLINPTNWIRIMCGTSGILLTGAGVYAMMHAGSGIEVPGIGRAPVPSTGMLPMGILLVGTGGVLLFFAFHNLPADVKTFGEFMAYMAQHIQQGTVQATGGVLPGGTGQAPPPAVR